MVAAVVLIIAERDRIPQTAQEIADIPGVAEVYSVSGEWDLVAIIRVPTWEEIAEVVTTRIAKVEGIERTNTLTSFRIYSREEIETAHDMFE